jgi:hypothetical protein
MPRFDAAVSAFDAANAGDPHKIAVDGELRPAELVYAERMSATLTRLYAGASEALQLAARAQHLQRWRIPRTGYPEGRAGYLRWRNDLKRKHAEWATELLGACGYPSETIARVGQLIRKENLAADPEAQALEDVACIVFLEHYLAQFAEKHDDQKLAGILSKTWAKMSPLARREALKLTLPERAVRLIRSLPAGGST